MMIERPAFISQEKLLDIKAMCKSCIAIKAKSYHLLMTAHRNHSHHLLRATS